MAYRESYIDMNPTEGVIHEFKKRKDWDQVHKEALTEKEQEALIEYASTNVNYRGLLPIITVLLGTGMRCGELIGLTWDDINFQRNVISINHTMNYTVSLSGKCEYIITTPKTKNSNREIPMLKEVRETLEEMYERREDFNAGNQPVIDGYTGFIFRDLYGSVYNNRRINESIKRLIRDRNEEETKKAAEEGRKPFLLRPFTCHNLRHTFCSQLILNGCNIKTCQILMGHSHAETTMRIYANITNSQNMEEMKALEGKMRLR